MTGAHVLVELVVVLGTAAVITLLFQALRLPVVLGYVVAGLLIGPNVPTPLVANAGLIHVLSELGVILLMFALGLELRLSTLARVGLGAGLTALFEVALVLTLGALVAGALGFGASESIFAGACVGISSTMLVAKAFEERKWKGGFTEVVFAILVFEDLIAILLLAILTGLASGAGLAPYDLAITLGELVGFLAAMLIGGLLVIPRMIRIIARQRRAETLVITSLAVCFGLAIVSEHFEYPVALGAFVAGLLVAESGHGHEVSDLVRPFRDVFAMMFFVSIGMTIEPVQLVDELPAILLFTAVVLIAKPLGVSLGSFAAGRGVQPSIRSGISLAQIGELSFVIAGIGVASGVARPSLLAIAVGVTCLTTLTSSVMIGRSEQIAQRIATSIPDRLGTFLSFYESWLGKLRSREATAWRRVRRPVFILIADAVAIVAIVIGGAQVHAVPKPLIVLFVILAMSPFAASLARRVAQVARLLSQIVIPAPASHVHPAAAAIDLPLDLGASPRRALKMMLELAIAGVIAIPSIAATQPFIGTTGLVVITIVIALIAITYRSIVDFDQHVRAGSELILELLHQPQPEPLGHVETMLPGFSGLTSITVGGSCAGRSLAELDLRARTGATVLAIARGEGGFATPEPTEPLRAGDVLALFGSDEAIAAARSALAGG